jgi:hypothetical protein
MGREKRPVPMSSIQLSHPLVLVLACAGHAVAQQELYACTYFGDIVEVRDYAGTPSLRVLPKDPAIQLGNDLAVGALDGRLYLYEFNFSLPTMAVIERANGVLVSLSQCFSPAGVSSALEALPDGRLVGEDTFSGQILYTGTVNPNCFETTGPATMAANAGDVALFGDGTLLATRNNSTVLERVDLVTGAVTILGDPGVAFTGLEVDTQGEIYGLTAVGQLYRVERTSMALTLVTTLPASGGNGWTGLAFLLPAGPLEVSLACTARPNSTGSPAELSVGAPTAGSVPFTARSLPPMSATLLLAGPTVALSPLGAGQLCLGSGIARLYPATASSSTGVAQFAVGLSFVPGHGPVQSGDRLYFQAWFRDTSATQQATVNLTDALCVQFL